MKSGFCPKCGSNEVRRYRHAVKMHTDMQIETEVSITNYICFECGYMESYADTDYLRVLEANLKVANEKTKRKNDE